MDLKIDIHPLKDYEYYLIWINQTTNYINNQPRGLRDPKNN